MPDDIDIKRQLSAIWQIIDTILPFLPAAALDAIPSAAIAELQAAADRERGSSWWPA